MHAPCMKGLTPLHKVQPAPAGHPRGRGHLVCLAQGKRDTSRQAGLADAPGSALLDGCVFLSTSQARLCFLMRPSLLAHQGVHAVQVCANGCALKEMLNFSSSAPPECAQTLTPQPWQATHLALQRLHVLVCICSEGCGSAHAQMCPGSRGP